MASRRVLSLVTSLTRDVAVFRPQVISTQSMVRNLTIPSRAAFSEAQPETTPEKPKWIKEEVKRRRAEGEKLEAMQALTTHFRPLNKLRPLRKKRPLTAVSPQAAREKAVVALSLAESFDLNAVAKDARFTSLFNVSFIDQDFDDALYIAKKKEYNVNDELSEMFLFGDGVIVFWNVEANQRVSILRDLEVFATGPYDSRIALEEQDRMPFIMNDHQGFHDDMVYAGYSSGLPKNVPLIDHKTRIMKDKFCLDREKHGPDHRSDPSSIIERFALSQGFAASVKIGVWEYLMNELSEPLSESTRKLKEGTIPWGRKETLTKLGDFAALRHTINLDCNLLSRDFYWNREEDEKYCEMSEKHFLVERRLRELNVRLDYCEELVKQVDNVLAVRHASKLEWLIILLIVIEVIFDVYHFADTAPKKVIVVAEAPVVTSPSDAQSL